MNGRRYFGLRAPGGILGRRLGWISRRRRRNLWRLDRLADCLGRCGHLRMNHVGSTRYRLIGAIRPSGGRKARSKVLEGRASVPPKTPMLGFRCQALISLSLPSSPLEYLADGFPAQAVLHQRGARDFRVLVRIGDNLFVALANLFKRESWVSHGLMLRPIRS